MRTDNKLHERAETPDGWRAENVQAGHGCLEALTEPRESSEAANGFRQLGCEEVVFGNIDSIAGSKKNVVRGSLASVIELHLDFLS